MSKKSILTVLFVLLIYPFNCFAMTVGDYQTLRDGSSSDFAALYITGVGVGMSVSNVGLLLKDRKELFCQPKDLVIGAKDYDAILRNYFRNIPATG